MKMHMTNRLSPIILFTYKRLDTLIQTIESLRNNNLATESELFIFSDAAKKDAVDAVNEVRAYLRTITGFKKVTIFEEVTNKGLASSIIDGVTTIINKFDKAIVLEDDLLLAPNFLDFMNAALDKYIDNHEVYSVSGFIFDIVPDKGYPYDIFFTKRHCSWGWAIWKDRWNKIDWAVKDFEEFINSETNKKKFNEIGSDLTGLLKKQMRGEINSWAIRCNYDQFKRQTHTVYPLKSKVVNIGFNDDATHTKQRFNRYETTLDAIPKYTFNFPVNVSEEKKLLKQFKRRYSKTMRLWYYILNKIWK
jgi:hypothetical protein